MLHLSHPRYPRYVAPLSISEYRPDIPEDHHLAEFFDIRSDTHTSENI